NAVGVRVNRNTYYLAESDRWQVIRNVLDSRERREVQIALQVLGDSVAKLQSANDQLSAEEQALAKYYLERIDDLQAFFEFAQMALETVLGGQETLDFDSVKIGRAHV